MERQSALIIQRQHTRWVGGLDGSVALVDRVVTLDLVDLMRQIQRTHPGATTTMARYR